MSSIAYSTEDMELLSAWGVRFRASRSAWPYERVMQAAQDLAVRSTGKDVTVDGRPAEPAEVRALASLMFYGLAEPVERQGEGRIDLTDDGREQLLRWSRLTPLGGEQR
ncbi:hypothetical protein CFN78_28180 [Amycolatopsis antarctica]|uniref:Uncharacterized protein n=1 Tax=Amycolatopsis antarctica TaxID=1854586 RepID=A0A263CUW5_9PSEU|nr:hypothetical protein [Amycolatopsis antarctica]OZM69904.1 hypothetical protein CFN78_28180 [Amycolatopsis antarctica]